MGNNTAAGGKTLVMSDADHSLWRTWQAARDDHAFETLVRPHLRFATDLARRHGCRPDEADDVVQEALTKLARASGERPVEVGLRTWLARSVKLESLMLHRSNRRRTRREQAYAVARETPTAPATGADDVEAALASLSDIRREAVVLRYLHDLEYREIARVLGISENACRLRVHKAMGEMRRRLGREPGALVAALPFLAGVRSPESLAYAATTSATTGIGAAALLGVLAMKNVLILTLVIAASVAAYVIVSDDESDAARTPSPDDESTSLAELEGEIEPALEPAPSPDPASGPLVAQKPDRQPKSGPAGDLVSAVFEAGGAVLVDRGAGKTPRRVRKDEPMPAGDIVGVSIPANKVQVLIDNAAALGDIRWLEIDSMRVRGQGLVDDTLALVLEHVDLHHLDIRRNPITDAGFEAIAGQRNLRTAQLSNLRISDAALRHLGQLRDLEELDIGDNKISSDGLAHLSGLRLKKIAFGETNIDDRGFEHLKDMALEEIEIHEHQDVSGGGVAHLDLRRLEVFDADEAGDVDDSLMEALSNAPVLRELIVKETKVTDKGLEHIKGVRSLEELDLNDTKITSAGLVHLIEMPNLRDLNLNETAIGDDAIPHLIRMRSLEKLSVRDTRITKGGVARLREALPDCRIKDD